MKKHIELLGILHLVYAGVGLLFAAFVFALLTTVGFVAHDDLALHILTLVAVVIAGIVTVLSVPGIVAGIGLLKSKSWSRPLALIVGCLHLLSFPFGTALGVYTLWVLLNDESRQLLA